MTVAENVALGARTSQPGALADDAISARLTELSERHGLHVDPSAVVGDLSVGERQRLEIVKALYRGARVLILDEPSAVLTSARVAHAGRGSALARRPGNGDCPDHPQARRDPARRLALHGDASGPRRRHRRRRRRGQAEAGPDDGRSRRRPPRPVHPPSKPGNARCWRLEGRLLVDERGRELLNDIDFTIRAGETFGIAGVEGNGQWPLVQVLTGLVAHTAGKIRIGGRDVGRLAPRHLHRGRQAA